MNSHPFLSMVDACPPLAVLSLPTRLSLAEVGRQVHFASGERIVSLSRPLRDILIVLEGLAKLVGVTEEGVERILYLYRPCEIIGSRILLERSSESPFEIIAMKEIHALAIPKNDFLAIAKDHPELLESVTSSLLRRVDRLTSWMLAAMSTDASHRLSKLLLDLAEGNPPDDGFVSLEYTPTHETLAQIIGASRPHTTTLLRELEEAGAVRRLKPRGLLVSPEKLERILRTAVGTEGRV
ncbi:MAG TPA: Crp/Fnr family transcriptional regulator [Gemmatimonadota bacterium]|nr:Crp/Fnr family transcriptional regulator [Gemmatimonadota bacterium]